MREYDGKRDISLMQSCALSLVMCLRDKAAEIDVLV